MIPLDNATGPEPPRDSKGRYRITRLNDGQTRSFTRATTIAEAIDDRHHLEKWKMRQVARGIGLRADLYALASSHHADDDKRLYDRLCDQALEASKSSAAASTGTALHRFTEQLDRGAITVGDVPEQWRPTCQLYLDTLQDAGIDIDPAGIEQVVIDDRYQVAGTVDRLGLQLPDGRRVVGELKTGKSLDWSWLAISIQLAIYAHHTATWTHAGGDRWTRGPRVEVDTITALVIHLPATGPHVGTCRLYYVDLQAGWDAYLTALEVRGHRRDAKKTATLIDPQQRAWLVTRMQAILGHPQAAADLGRCWPPGLARPFPRLPTPDQIDLLAAALDVVEDRHQLAFHGQPTEPTNNHHLQGT